MRSFLFIPAAASSEFTFNCRWSPPAKISFSARPTTQSAVIVYSVAYIQQ